MIKIFFLSFFLGPLLLASPLVPEEVDASWWREKHQRFLKLVNSHQRVDFLFLGDSITEGWYGPGFNIWKKYFIPLHSANFGIGGDRIENVLWRIQNGELKNISPKKIILLIGTNNLPYHHPFDIFLGHQNLVQEIQKRLPQSQIIVYGIFPRVDDWSLSFRHEIKPLNQKIKKESKVLFVDIGHFFEDPCGNIPLDMMPDGLHLSEKAYELWAYHLKQLLP